MSVLVPRAYIDPVVEIEETDEMLEYGQEGELLYGDENGDERMMESD